MKNYMSKIESRNLMIAVAIFLAAAIVLSASFFLEQTTGTANAQNSCPSIAPYKCNNGSCTNDPDLCNQSWGGGLSNDNPEDTPSTSGSSSSNNLGNVAASGQKCSGNLRYDAKAAEECAAIAQAQGRALGYDITCNSGSRSEFIVENANPVGTQSAYQPTCTINGVPGFGAQTLAGYTGSGPGYTVYDPFLGTTQAFGSGYNLNSMWYSVPCTLVDSFEGKPGGGALVGAHTCTSGASQYFGSNSPSTWTAANSNRPTGGSSTTGSQTNTSNTNQTSNTSSGIKSPIVRAEAKLNSAGKVTPLHVNSFLAVVMDIVDTAKRFYGIQPTFPAGFINPQYSETGATITGQGSGNSLPSTLYTASIDKTNQCVGQNPVYTVVGPSNLVGSKVLWSSRFNNVATQEFDSDYGYILDSKSGQAYWSASGDTWTSAHIGSWEKTSNVNGLLQTIKFNVGNCTPAVTPVSCTPKNTTWSNTFSVIPMLNAAGGNGIYTWTAPGSTKTEGVGTLFTTSYASGGNYEIKVMSAGTTDTCSVKIGG